MKQLYGLNCNVRILGKDPCRHLKVEVIGDDGDVEEGTILHVPEDKVAEPINYDTQEGPQPIYVGRSR